MRKPLNPKLTIWVVPLSGGAETSGRAMPVLDQSRTVTLNPKSLPATPTTPGLRLMLNAEGTRLLTTVVRSRSDL